MFPSPYAYQECAAHVDENEPLRQQVLATPEMHSRTLNTWKWLGGFAASTIIGAKFGSDIATESNSKWDAVITIVGLVGSYVTLIGAVLSASDRNMKVAQIMHSPGSKSPEAVPADFALEKV